MNKFDYLSPMTDAELCVPVYTDDARRVFGDDIGCGRSDCELMVQGLAQSKFFEFDAPNLTSIKLSPIDTTSFNAWANAHKYKPNALATHVAYARTVSATQAKDTWGKGGFQAPVAVCVIAVKRDIATVQLNANTKKALTQALSKISGLAKHRIQIADKMFASEKVYHKAKVLREDAGRLFKVGNLQGEYAGRFEYAPKNEFMCIPVYIQSASPLLHNPSLYYSYKSKSLALDTGTINSILAANGIAGEVCWETLIPVHSIPGVYEMMNLKDSEAYYSAAVLATRMSRHGKNMELTIVPIGDENKKSTTPIPTLSHMREYLDVMQKLLLRGGGFVIADVGVDETNHVLVGYALNILGDVSYLSKDDTDRLAVMLGIKKDGREYVGEEDNYFPDM